MAKSNPKFADIRVAEDAALDALVTWVRKVEQLEAEQLEKSAGSSRDRQTAALDGLADISRRIA
jgi:hypothetical protein